MLCQVDLNLDLQETYGTRQDDHLRCTYRGVESLSVRGRDAKLFANLSTVRLSNRSLDFINMLTTQ